MKNYIAKNLKTIRKANGLTQGGLAQILKIHINNIGKYETGTNPPINSLINIAQIFKISMDDLILSDLSKDISFKPNRNMLKKYAKISYFEHLFEQNNLLKDQIQALKNTNEELSNAIKILTQAVRNDNLQNTVNE